MDMFRLDMNRVIKVADFGLSVAVADEKNYFQCRSASKVDGTRTFVRPQFSEFSDVVSFPAPIPVLCRFR